MRALKSNGVTDVHGRSRNLLLIAVRDPRPGSTKTRLGHTIGNDRAAALYGAFLVDLAAELTPPHGAENSYQFGWAYTPATTDFRALISRFDPRFAHDGVLFVPQFGADWGEGQTNLLRWGHLRGFERTVLIASDSPHLKRSTIESAFALLANSDVVMGRVHDGGYYLIGNRGFHDVLRGVPMSTSSAADAVCARATSLKLRLAETQPTFDVDIEDDLALLRAELSPFGSGAPATWRALQRLSLAAPLMTPGLDAKMVRRQP